MKLDSIDLVIINILRKDGRKSFTSIAKKLDISPAAVHKRFSKMEKAGLIKGFTLPTNFSGLGGYIAQMGIKTVNSETNNVIEYLYRLKLRNASIYCWKCIGTYNIFVWFFLKDLLSIHTIRHILMQNPAVTETNISILTEYTDYTDKIDVGDILKK